MRPQQKWKATLDFVKQLKNSDSLTKLGSTIETAITTKKLSYHDKEVSLVAASMFVSNTPTKSYQLIQNLQIKLKGHQTSSSSSPTHRPGSGYRQ